MTPNLPPNPMTITPPDKHCATGRTLRTGDMARLWVTNRSATPENRAEALRQLDILNRWDTFERQTEEQREEAKVVLCAFLNPSQRSRK